MQEPLNTKPLSPSEAALSKLLAEKSRRHEELVAKGEAVTLRVIIRPGQNEQEVMRLVPKPKGKMINWIRRIIIKPPPPDPSSEWHGQQVDPVEVAKREVDLEPDRLEPKSYFYISMENGADDGSHAGRIEEGYYNVFDGAVIVTDKAGRRIGSAPDTGNPVRVARTILRKHIGNRPKPLQMPKLGIV